MANQSRRRFIRNGALSIAALPIGAGMLTHGAFANSLPRLSTSSSSAQALNYVESASEASDHPAYSAGETCSNCMFFNSGTEGCQLFPENSVAPGGWCQSWISQG